MITVCNFSERGYWSVEGDIFFFKFLGQKSIEYGYLKFNPEDFIIIIHIFPKNFMEIPQVVQKIKRISLSI